MGDGYSQEIYNEVYSIRYKLDAIEEYLSKINKEIVGLRSDMRKIAGGDSPPPIEQKKRGIFNL
ncbi:MAG: hypothetical protein ABIH11_04720 [Candidatus Altiarchaeota archaeon]